MKRKYLILVGAVLGWAVVFALFVYGRAVVDDAQAGFKNLVQYNTKTIVYKAMESDSKIAIMWAEEEQMPWKKVITVRVNGKLGKTRQIVFQKQ